LFAAIVELLPSAVCNLPPLAGVGMTEPQAINSGMHFHINRETMTGGASSCRIDQKRALYEVLLKH
jgi:pyruvate/2-oxoglutarate dehydrogenase complex dihydrolipoamide dehydrogenase (E3) component